MIDFNFDLKLFWSIQHYFFGRYCTLYYPTRSPWYLGSGYWLSNQVSECYNVQTLLCAFRRVNWGIVVFKNKVKSDIFLHTGSTNGVKTCEYGYLYFFILSLDPVEKPVQTVSEPLPSWCVENTSFSFWILSLYGLIQTDHRMFISLLL